MRRIAPYLILSTLVGGSLLIVAGLQITAFVATLLGLLGLGYLVHDHYQDKATQRRRIAPDANGLYPIDSQQLSREVAQHVAMTLAGGAMAAAVERAKTAQQVPQTYAPRIEVKAPTPSAAPALLSTDASPALEAPAVPALPHAPTFAQLVLEGFHARTDRMLLGFGVDGPIYGGIDNLLSTAIAGRPGQGKSTTLRMVYAQCLQIGADVMLLDPHGSIAGDVQSGPSQLVASTGAELDDAAAWLSGELERRLSTYRAGERSFRPLLVMADEMPVIALSSKAAVQALGRVVLEARKVGGYALISGQGLPASNFGGRLVRDALSSRIIHKTTAAEGLRAGLDKTAAQMLEHLRPGYAILDGPTIPQIVAIPLTTADDLSKLSYVPAFQPEPVTEPVLGTPVNAVPERYNGKIVWPAVFMGSQREAPAEPLKMAVNGEQPAPLVDVPEAEKIQILTLAKAGLSRRKIALQVYGGMGKYDRVRSVLDGQALDATGV